MFLFKIEDVFEFTGRGIVLFSKTERVNHYSIGQRVKIVKPDNSEFETQIIGFGMTIYYEILVSIGFLKSDFPIGSEVWLIEENI